MPEEVPDCSKDRFPDQSRPDRARQGRGLEAREELDLDRETAAWVQGLAWVFGPIKGSSPCNDWAAALHQLIIVKPGTGQNILTTLRQILSDPNYHRLGIWHYRPGWAIVSFDPDSQGVCLWPE